MSYCVSRFRTVRRRPRGVKVGSVGVGGDNPIRIQSMTTSDTQDVAATVRQSIALAEVGCEIVRITAPNVPAARCLREIRDQFTAAGFGHVPLVADIHFLPQAAMEAVEHVEKVRVNPGNYADKKKFAVREYSDADYESELQRLHDAFSPLVKRAKELGRALRIGTNHGSLSDRIMNRYGDTPLGMVESALEFLRIAESHSYRQLILSMKASNPKVMIQAYRLLVERMQQENMHYPLHLGVTEAGDGEDGRIKSSIGIGSLLLDGLGDTIRVSLTEDSVYEVPVARAIAEKTMSLWGRPEGSAPAESGVPATDGIDPYRFVRREPATISLSDRVRVGPEQPPRVIVRATPEQLGGAESPARHPQLRDTPAEGILLTVKSAAELETLPPVADATYVLELDSAITLPALEKHARILPRGTILVRQFAREDAPSLRGFLAFVQEQGLALAIDADPAALAIHAPLLREHKDAAVIVAFGAAADPRAPFGHRVGAYRQIGEILRAHAVNAPIWIRNTASAAVLGDNSFLSKLIEASFLSGALLCDGFGDLISIETEADPVRATRLCYNVLQGAGARISKTEFVACPSCGRTLFDLQTTTQRNRAQTGHLKGVKIAIMGCIVNGPGEMADADFGYVGGAPGKINLYVGKQCVQYNIPQVEADARLIALIREHGKWVDPDPAGVAVSK